jgi:hypothetical protein
MNPVKLLAPSTILAALILLAACGGDDPATPDAGGAEPDLSTIEESLVDDGATPEDPSVDDPMATTPTDLPDPCTLLAPETATAVIGEPATSSGAVPQLGTNGLECTYAATSGSSLAIQVASGREAYDIAREQGTGGFADAGDTQDVSGLGEDAYVGIGSYGPVKISWFQDDLALAIEIRDVGATEPRTVAEYEDLAHQVSDQIG